MAMPPVGYRTREAGRKGRRSASPPHDPALARDPADRGEEPGHHRDDQPYEITHPHSPRAAGWPYPVELTDPGGQPFRSPGFVPVESTFWAPLPPAQRLLPS